MPRDGADGQVATEKVADADAEVATGQDVDADGAQGQHTEKDADAEDAAGWVWDVWNPGCYLRSSSSPQHHTPLRSYRSPRPHTR